MEYLKFYKLAEEPFRNDPDPRAYYEGPVLARTRTRVLRIVEQRKGLCTVVGESGSGKTMLARRLLDELAGDSCEVRLLTVPHAECDGGWLRSRVAHEFGVTRPSDEPLEALGQIYSQLVVFEAEGKLPLLLIDDAQLLRGAGAFDELRGLLSLEHRGQQLLTLLLFGVPEFDALVSQHPSFGQRVDARVRMNPLDRAGTEQFLRARLASVGGDPGLFAEQEVDAIHRFSGGVPRLINTLADNSLFEGSLSESDPVDVSAIAAAAEQLGLAPAEGARVQPAAPRGVSLDQIERSQEPDFEIVDSSAKPGPEPTRSWPPEAPASASVAAPEHETAAAETPIEAANASETESDLECSGENPLEDANADSLSGLDALFDKIRLKT